MPDTFTALLLLFFFGTPAYVSTIVYKKRNLIRYHQETQSPIEQASLYIFLSAITNIVIVLLCGGIWEILASIKKLPHLSIELLSSFKDTYFGLYMIFLSLPIYLILALILSGLIAEILEKVSPVEKPLIMEELSKLKATQEIVPWILVHFKNGDEYLGLVDNTKWVGGKENSMELVLEKAIYKLADNKGVENIGRVLLRSEDILWLSPYKQ